jgi:hypothetical protein
MRNSYPCLEESRFLVKRRSPEYEVIQTKMAIAKSGAELGIKYLRISNTLPLGIC